MAPPSSQTNSGELTSNVKLCKQKQKKSNAKLEIDLL